MVFVVMMLVMALIGVIMHFIYKAGMRRGIEIGLKERVKIIE